MSQTVKELEFSDPEHRCDWDDVIVFAYGDWGRISVLDRITGYGFGVRDTETGYMDKQNNWWLASGMFDIRNYPELTIEEAIDKIKSNASFTDIRNP